jgi:hypothetical protein
MIAILIINVELLEWLCLMIIGFIVIKINYLKNKFNMHDKYRYFKMFLIFIII